jgi:uncharacterized iron-regulated protein
MNFKQTPSAWLLAACLTASMAGGCATPSPAESSEAARIAALMPADAILLGEQHVAPAHQRMHREVIRLLAERGQLAGVAIEMAEHGASTANLKRSAGEELVQTALGWDETAWPWRAYGPAVMEAVRAGVPVLGANLPRTAMRPAMANATLDGLLPGPALKAQQQAIRIGHCQLLPESQIQPMTRIQLARDQAMAQTLLELRVPGKAVVLMAGAGHVDASLGVPQYLPKDFEARSVALTGSDAPAKDHCEALRKQMMKPESGMSPQPRG